MTVTAEWQLVLAVLSSVLGVALAIRLGAKDLMDHIDARFTAAEATHKQESAAFKELLDQKYVTRSEFVCEMSKARENSNRVEAKLDRAILKHHGQEPE